MAKRFAVYKGLQRPLTFKGFKGKFIYWGVGSLLLGLVAGSITMALVNMYVGAAVLVAIIVGGLFYTASRQKGGLHDKPEPRGIYIHPVNLKILKVYGKQKRV
ncbi:plasmid transfer protein [Mucilaginibacter sp. PAMB04274]|uniref:plasmid transfer protein n=1 Tax=Mucilaginibacter sp. PAMB04274 TaxID=3138568 RepID=UPI0031F6F190